MQIFFPHSLLYALIVVQKQVFTAPKAKASNKDNIFTFSSINECTSVSFNCCRPDKLPLLSEIQIKPNLRIIEGSQVESQ